MKEELIQVETALLAKGKGFDPEAMHYYHDDSDVLFNGTWDNGPVKYNSDKDYEGTSAASSQSLLQRWLREVHEIVVYVSFETIDDSETAYVWNIITSIPEGKGSKKNTWDFYERRDSFSKHMIWYSTYETALEAALQNALKLIV